MTRTKALMIVRMLKKFGYGFEFQKYNECITRTLTIEDIRECVANEKLNPSTGVRVLAGAIEPVDVEFMRKEALNGFAIFDAELKGAILNEFIHEVNS